MRIKNKAFGLVYYTSLKKRLCYKMRPSVRIVLLLMSLWNYFLLTDANAMLKPTHRGVMWTRGSFNSAGYNYMGINCGGIFRFKKNNGQCGLCGDAFDGPRNHETGGKYATGAISEVIKRGVKNIPVKILLNADQAGYFEFRLCASNGVPETQQCFDKHLMKITEGRVQGDEFAYIVERAGIIPLTLEIPEKLHCDKCVLQWKYVTGNTFGRDGHGIGCLGCGHQETFVNCADITIKGWELPATPAPPPPTIPPTPPPTPPPTTPPVPTTIMWTTTTEGPITTTTPPPTTRALTTTTKRPTKKPKPTQNTQRAYASKHRQSVTDVDEGSRRRMQKENGRKSSAYSPVAAPPQTPAVVPPNQQRSPPAGSAAVPAPVNHAPAYQQPAVVTETPKTLQNVNSINAGIVTNLKTQKFENREKRFQNVPFKIPRPPRLSNEQIDALNNNRNVMPHHDPLQKYVKVGSSRIVAAVDFTTMRAQQVQTPPTIPRSDIHKSKSGASVGSIGQPARHVQPSYRSNTKQKSTDMFSSFGNEMLGAPAAGKPRHGGNLMNEYSFVRDAPYNMSKQRAATAKKINIQGISGDLFSEFAFDNTNANVLNSGKRVYPNVQNQYGPTNTHRNNQPGNQHLYADHSQVHTSQQKQASRQTGRLPSANTNPRYPQLDRFGNSNNRVYPQQPHSMNAASKESSVLTGHQQPRSDIVQQQPVHGYSGMSETSRFRGNLNSFENNMAKQNTFYSGQVSNFEYDQMPMKGSPASNYGNINRGRMIPNRHVSSQTSQISQARVSNTGNEYNPYGHNQSPFGGARENNPVKSRKTTSLPVVDTSTHRSKKQKSDIASRRRLPVQPNLNLNAPVLHDKPVNLFKDQDRTTFKKPVVFERFTNYQVGKGRETPNNVPKNEHQTSNVPQEGVEQAPLTTSETQKNFHLNAGIHSPETYFGQNHYISQDVEVSVPAFGGPKTQDSQSQKELNLGHHEISTAQKAPQSFNNKHLNYALHSPQNYFPHKRKDVYQGQGPLNSNVANTNTNPDFTNSGVPGSTNFGTLSFNQDQASFPFNAASSKTSLTNTRQQGLTNFDSLTGYHNQAANTNTKSDITNFQVQGAANFNPLSGYQDQAVFPLNVASTRTKPDLANIRAQSMENFDPMTGYQNQASFPSMVANAVNKPDLTNTRVQGLANFDIMSGYQNQPSLPLNVAGKASKSDIINTGKHSVANSNVFPANQDQALFPFNFASHNTKPGVVKTQVQEPLNFATNFHNQGLFPSNVINTKRKSVKSDPQVQSLTNFDSLSPYQDQARFPFNFSSRKAKADKTNIQAQGVSNFDTFSKDKAYSRNSGNSPQKPSVPKPVTTTKVTQTTNALDFQLKELNSLRDKLERLQILLHQRTTGFQSEPTTTVNLPPASNQPETMRTERNLPVNKLPNAQGYNKNYMAIDTQNTGFKLSNSNVENTIAKPSTVPPGMSKKTTKFLNDFKAQMLQSIKDANAKKRQTFASKSKKSDVLSTRPYNKETTTRFPPGNQKMQQNAQKQIQENETMKQKREQEKKMKYRKLLELLIERRRQKQLTAKQEQTSTAVNHQQQTAPSVQQQQPAPSLQQPRKTSSNEKHHLQDQNAHQSNQVQKMNQQTLHQKSILLPSPPRLAEIQTSATKKQRIIQKPQTTSIRPVDTIQTPDKMTQQSDFQKSNANSDEYKPTAVKTTIDKLADRIAVGMADKLKSENTGGIPNFKVVPLSSGSVMDTLRNIALSVLKNQKLQSEIPDAVSKNENYVMQKAMESKSPLLVKPSTKKNQSSQKVPNQQIVSVNTLTTSLNKQTDIPSTSQQTITTNQIPAQISLGPSDSQNSLAKRQELIRKMKMLMLKRRPTHIENSKSRNNNRPVHLPNVRPSHLGKPEVVGTKPLQSNNNNRPVHIIGHPNNGRPTIYDKQTTNKQRQTTSTQKLTTSNQRPLTPTTGRLKQQQTNESTSVTMKSIHTTQNSATTTTKRRVSPDIARSMLVRVRQMLANKKNNERKSNSTSLKVPQGMSTKDVLVMPLSQDVLFKLLNSMQNRTAKSGG